MCEHLAGEIIAVDEEHFVCKCGEIFTKSGWFKMNVKRNLTPKRKNRDTTRINTTKGQDEFSLISQNF